MKTFIRLTIGAGCLTNKLKGGHAKFCHNTRASLTPLPPTSCGCRFLNSPSYPAFYQQPAGVGQESGNLYPVRFTLLCVPHAPGGAREYRQKFKPSRKKENGQQKTASKEKHLRQLQFLRLLHQQGPRRDGLHQFQQVSEKGQDHSLLTR